MTRQLRLLKLFCLRCLTQKEKEARLTAESTCRLSAFSSDCLQRFYAKNSMIYYFSIGSYRIKGDDWQSYPIREVVSPLPL